MDGLGWMSRRQRDGGIDRVPLPDGVDGALWLCGKHAIGPDHARAISEVGGDAIVVCLTEEHELADRYPAYLLWLRSAAGGDAIWAPVHDLHAPPVDAAEPLVRDLAGRLVAGDTLLVHCAAGMGRTGTIAACVLIALGHDTATALEAVGAARPGAGPEVGAQRDLVETIAARLR